MVDASPEVPGSERAPAGRAAAEFGALLRALTPRAWLVPAIVALNAIAFLLMVARGVNAFEPAAKDVLAWGADYGPRTLGGEPWRLLVNTFLHFGILHLAMNMVALWDAGRLVERLFGQARFAAIYLAAALCGSVASIIVHPQVIAAGASGAVFGVYGALGAFLLRQRGAIPAPVVTKLSKVALGFIGYNMVYGFILPSIDVAGHVGGLLGGAAAGAWLARPIVPGRPGSPARPGAVVALALGVAAAAVAALPRPVDVTAVLDRFSSDEKGIIAAYNALIDRSRKDELSDADLATALESNVIAPWRAARARLEAPKRPARQRRVVDLLVRYSTAREAGWSSMVKALQARDAKLIDEMRAHEAEAQSALDELNHLKP